MMNFPALKYICQTIQTLVAVDKGDTDIDESFDSESSSAAESSVVEVQNESAPMTIDTSDDEPEDGPLAEKKTSLRVPSTTPPKPMLKQDSSDRNALEFAKDHQDSNIGLLKYFSQGTKKMWVCTGRKKRNGQLLIKRSGIPKKALLI
jgi:hypothetical protein